jgi:hypothetical protein
MRSSPSFVIYVYWQPDGYREFTATSVVLGILKKSPNISNKAQMLAKAQEISSLWISQPSRIELSDLMRAI